MNAALNYHLNPAELLSEQDVVAKAKADPKQFAPLYNRYHEQVFRFVYQRLDDKDTASDICSQVFLKAMLNLGKYESRGVPFGAWLYRIALTELAQMFRSRKAQRTLNVDTEGMKEMAGEMEGELPEDFHEALVEAMAGLDEEELQLIEMRYFEKRPFKEIAEIKDITENNAKVRLYRLLNRMKATITQKS